MIAPFQINLLKAGCARVGRVAPRAPLTWSGVACLAIARAPLRPRPALGKFLLPIACCLWLAIPFAAFSQSTVTNVTFDNLNLAIPDGNLSGIANTQTVAGLSGTISSIQVGLNLAGTGDGAFNGDLYALLVNGADAFAVLLNRPGVTGSNPWGYSDNGLNVIFFDTGSDIHLYQSGIYSTNSAGQLTGTWAPDGRNVSPLTVSDTTPQTAMLSNFIGTSPDGTWTLFLVDASNGGTAELSGWSLDIQTEIPEPGTPQLLLLGLALAAGIWKSRRG